MLWSIILTMDKWAEKNLLHHTGYMQIILLFSLTFPSFVGSVVASAVIVLEANESWVR